jgi:hypothetical protein
VFGSKDLNLSNIIVETEQSVQKINCCCEKCLVFVEMILKSIENLRFKGRTDGGI